MNPGTTQWTGVQTFMRQLLKTVFLSTHVSQRNGLSSPDLITSTPKLYVSVSTYIVLEHIPQRTSFLFLSVMKHVGPVPVIVIGSMLVFSWIMSLTSFQSSRCEESTIPFLSHLALLEFSQFSLGAPGLKAVRL